MVLGTDMAKSCETFDHTADIGLSASADSMEELFEAMAEGLTDVICSRSGVEARQRRTITVAAEDIEALAVDFLSEIMITIQTSRFAIAEVKVTQTGDCSVTAELSGEPLDPETHEIHTEVKAVTYHLLDVAKYGRRWSGRVVLDI